MDTALIVPACGRGLRLKSPYPKALLTAGEHMLLIDYALRCGAVAGVDTAFVVVPAHELKLFAQIVTAEKYGIRIVFTLLQDQDLDCDAGTIFRGCRRANLADAFNKFLVVPCDLYLPEHELEILLTQPDPAVLVDSDRVVKVAHFDTKVLARLRRRLSSTPREEVKNNGQGIFARLLREEINISGTLWTETAMDESAVDVDTWADLKKVWTK